MSEPGEPGATLAEILVSQTDRELHLRVSDLTVTLNRWDGLLTFVGGGGAIRIREARPATFGSNQPIGAVVRWRIDGSALEADCTEARVRLDFSRPGSCRVLIVPGGASEFARLALEAGTDERFLGLGERFSQVDQRGKRVLGWAEDVGFPQSPGHPWTYWPVPFLVSSRGYGLLLRTTRWTELDLCATSPTEFLAEIKDGRLDYEIFFGPEPARVLDLYTQATGRPRIPPRWNNGVWRTALGGEAAVLAEARRIRREGIPCSALWVYDAHDPIGNIGWPINPMHHSGHYPDIPRFVDELHQLGFKVQTYVFPYYYEGTPRFVEGVEHGYFVKSPDGSTYTWPFISAIRRGWPCAMVDFTNPEAVAWWQEQLRYVLVDLGFDGWMHDFGEYVPEQAIFHDGRTGRELHNLYPVLGQRAAREACDRYKPDASFYARSGFTGSQEWLTAAWTGDQVCTWRTDEGLPSALVACLSLGLSGVPYVGPDIGGYFGQVRGASGPDPDNFSKELWIRWTQFGALCPIMRDHLGFKPKEAVQLWTDAETIAGFRTYARFHLALSPYQQALAHEASRTGLPLMRHLAFEAPDDPRAWTCDDEYLLGDALLVGPILREGARNRRMYFPAGHWIGFWDGTEYIGPGEHEVPAPLHRIPLFARSGTLLPTLSGEPDTLAGASDPAAQVAGDDLRVRLYRHRGAPPGRAERNLGDGTRLTCTWNATEIRFEVVGEVGRAYELIASVEHRPISVLVNDRPAWPDQEATYDSASGTSRIRLIGRAGVVTIGLIDGNGGH